MYILCQEEWLKKILFYYYLNDSLVKLFFQAPCVQIHALYFVPAMQTLLHFWKLQQTSSGTCLTLSNSHLVTISNPPGNTEGFWHFTEPRLLLTPILFMNQAVKTAGSDCRHFRSRNISGKVKGVTKGCVVWVITTCYRTVSILLVIVDFCFPSPGQPHEPGPMLDVNARATYPVLVLSHSDISFFSSLLCPPCIFPSTFLHFPYHALQGQRLFIRRCCLSLQFLPFPSSGRYLVPGRFLQPSLFYPFFFIPAPLVLSLSLLQIHNQLQS